MWWSWMLLEYDESFRLQIHEMVEGIGLHILSTSQGSAITLVGDSVSAKTYLLNLFASLAQFHDSGMKYRSFTCVGTTEWTIILQHTT